MTRASSDSGSGALTVTLHGRGLLKVPAEGALLSRVSACPPGLYKYWGTVFCLFVWVLKSVAFRNCPYILVIPVS